MSVFTPKNYDEARKIATDLSKSTMIPTHFRGKCHDILALMMLAENLNIGVMSLIQDAEPLRGRFVVRGDALIAIVRSSSKCEYVTETFDESTMTATCKVKRINESEQVRTFSKADAQTAKLWGRQGPWSTHSMRMLQLRARAFALRDVFADVICGLADRDEQQDIVETIRHEANEHESNNNEVENIEVVQLEQEEISIPDIEEKELFAPGNIPALMKKKIEILCKYTNENFYRLFRVPPTSIMLENQVKRLTDAYIRLQPEGYLVANQHVLYHEVFIADRTFFDSSADESSLRRIKQVNPLSCQNLDDYNHLSKYEAQVWDDIARKMQSINETEKARKSIDELKDKLMSSSNDQEAQTLQRNA